MSRSELEAIEELVVVLDGGDAGWASELDRLAYLAGALREVPVARPRPEFTRSLRATLVREAAEMLPATPTPAPSVGERLARWRRSASLALASALSASTIGTAGMVAAAERSQPGDALYGAKRAGEQLRLSLASGAIETGRLHLAIAQRRLDEVVAGARTLAPTTLVDLLDAMDEASRRGAIDLLSVYDDTGDSTVLHELGRFVQQQRATLADIVDELPVEVVPFAQDSLEVVRRIEVQATALALAGCVPCDDGPFVILEPDVGPAMQTRPCCVPTQPVGDALPNDAASAAPDTEETATGPSSARPHTTTAPSGSPESPTEPPEQVNVPLTDLPVTNEGLPIEPPHLEPSPPVPSSPVTTPAGSVVAPITEPLTAPLSSAIIEPIESAADLLLGESP
ncbi:MAG TPA: DUF5667 domain-containing protein [Nitriliruptorales bacterium]|nr:DUF5667 domain-containing protein [Nitriliruptorales bacterium]